MHILEIIEPTIQNKQYSKNFSSISSPEKTFKDKNFLGKGVYAYAKKDRSDPHMAIKTSNDPHKRKYDKYWAYANIIIKNKLWENPYFPRLYVLKNIEDQHKNKMSRIKMEKLFPFYSLNKKELIFLLNKLFGEGEKLFDDLPPFSDLSTYDIFPIITHKIADVIELVKPLNKDADPLFVKAIKKLRTIRDDISGNFDIHPGNIMVRRTPYGPQLVFTDVFT